MALPSVHMHGISPVPAMPQPNDGGRIHSSSLSFSSSSSSGSEAESERRTRIERPRMSSRKPSSSIIVPRDHPEIEIEQEFFPPDDARAMSPRRDSTDMERLGKEARQILQEQAKTLQSSLQALAERIEEVKHEHDKLENENKFLQDYIGSLTQTVSKSELMSTTGAKARKSRK